ncbi:serine/threonine protein kinase [Corallococcus aberystwythensis]|uniref:Serine/threonine protein kinase n=1 Tax=Corallococcus aberystwythensis TaxID=2316722 RepID=A0A3A8PWF5_9BACT|nr:serine/threonine-protein kinase [Corallococcus aberystwythensis]RKH55814.1 serine/threonine protein kinase [Corallococcus aberystwythensis]
MSPHEATPGESQHPASTQPAQKPHGPARPALLLMADALPPGTPIGPWRVLRRVASGGYGTVYVVHAKHRPRGRRYALKLARQPDSPWFSREAEVLSLLRHPGVPRFVEAGAWRPGSGSHPFLVMEHVAGESLYEWARARNPTAREVGALLIQAVEVLAFAHQHGVLHRDVKGDNLRVQPGGRLTLLDWGAGWHPEAKPLTGTGQLPPGTAHYLSPQLHRWRMAAPSRECPRYGVADELYALGVTFHRLLTDSYPALTLEGEEPARAWPNPRVPDALASHVVRLLAFAPEARPASASALASELHQVLPHADATWDLPLFDWATPPSDSSRTTEEAPGMEGPVAPGQEVPLQHARLQRPDRIQRLREARELRRRVPRHVARMEAQDILAASTVRRRQTLRALWRHGAVGFTCVVSMVCLGWSLGLFSRPGMDASASPSMPPVARAPGPDQAAASGAAPPSPAPLRQEKDAMSIPLKQDPPVRGRSLSRGCTWVAGAATTLIACSGAQVVPKPQRCPTEALEAMKALKLRRDAKVTVTVDIRYPDRLDAAADMLAVHDGDIISVQEEEYGGLPKGTLLYGRLWTGGERVMGRYTRAETPDGRTYPVCFVLGNDDGFWPLESGSKPGAALLPRTAGYTVVDAFP